MALAKRKSPKERPGTPIDNRNFLSPTGFRFSIKRCPATTFFCNKANIPELNLGIAVQPSYLKDIDRPGEKIEFGDLNITFLVDEDLVNYMEIQKWIRGLGFPENLDQFAQLEKEAILGPQGKFENIYSDGVLQILSSNQVAKYQVVFQDLFPYSLSTLSFDATDTNIEYFTADVSFKYTIYNLTDMENKLL